MPYRTYFDPNPKVVDELKATGIVDKELYDKIAVPVSQIAKGLALTDAFETGAYMNSIYPGRRNGEAFVGAKDFKAHWIEFGTHNPPPYSPMRPRHILRRAFEAMGFHPRERSI